MHTMMMMMMTKTHSESTDDYVDAATGTMTQRMITMVITIMTMKKMVMKKTEADDYVDDTNDDNDTDDDDDDDDDERFMKISNCSCYLAVFFSKPYDATMEIKLFQQYFLVVIISV